MPLRTRIRFAAVVAAATAALLSSVAPPAGAITNGTPDGSAHPAVGALVAEWRTPGQRDVLCSGTLIAADVFLTAAHCTSFLESKGIVDVWVSFDERYTPSASITHGSMRTNPAYRGTGTTNPDDIAVVVLDQPVAVTPARLPHRGALNADLAGQRFTAVGYGAHAPEKTGPGRPTQAAPLQREAAVSAFRSITASFLHLSQNSAHGDGGTCNGDSGGPNFLGDSDVIAAITITGDTYCRATNVPLRLDTDRARAFLGEYVVLP